MSGDMKLSQAEIDALLGGVSNAMEPTEPSDDLTAEERDVLGELGNISYGSAATSLSSLLQNRVEITTPTVSVVRAQDLSSDVPRPYVMVAVEYVQGIGGTNALAIELNDAKTIADLMLGGDGHNTDMELNELHLSAVAEAMNQMMGGAATAMSTMLNCVVNISPPQVKVIEMANLDEEFGYSGMYVVTAFRLKVGSLIDSKLMQFVPIGTARDLLAMLSGGTSAAAEAAPTAAPTATPAVPSSMPNAGIPAAPVQSSPTMAPSVAYGVPIAPSQMGTPMGMAGNPGYFQADPSIQRPDFVDFGTAGNAVPAPRNLSLLFDVSLNVTVELGRTKKSIRDILDLAPGSILELDKLAGEPVDILVNNKRIAIGEVVVIDENFGVRVTDIISPVERVKNLQ